MVGLHLKQFLAGFIFCSVTEKRIFSWWYHSISETATDLQNTIPYKV